MTELKKNNFFVLTTHSFILLSAATHITNSFRLMLHRISMSLNSLSMTDSKHMNSTKHLQNPLRSEPDLNSASEESR